MPSRPTISCVGVSLGTVTLNRLKAPGLFYLLGTGDPGDTIHLFDTATGNEAGFPL